jgi:hypothetical protein
VKEADSEAEKKIKTTAKKLFSNFATQKSDKVNKATVMLGL